MDEKQTGKMDKNRHFHKYYQRPSYVPRKYFPNSDPNIKRGFWNGAPLKGRSFPTYIPGKTWNGRYNNRPKYKPVGTKLPSRSNSPIEGTEEYMTRKIQNTSAIIMRHLLTPSEEMPQLTKSSNNLETDFTKDDQLNCNSKNESTTLKSPSKLQNKKVNLHGKEIYDKIIKHIGKLAEGRKKNFINADQSTHWDQVITDMQKQQRLELSRILRTMSSNSISQATDDISSLLEPDVGIKLEDLPFDVIEELRNTLNIDLDQWNEEVSYENASAKVVDRLEPDEVLIEPKIEEPETYEQPTTCFSDASVQNTSPWQDANTTNVLENKSLDIKEELDHVFSESTVIASNLDQEFVLTIPNLDHRFSESSVTTANHTLNDCNDDQVSTATVSNVDHMRLLKSLETTIRETIKVNKQQEIVELKQIVEKTNLLDKCIEELTSYRKYLMESILNFHSELNNSHRTGNGVLSQKSCETRLISASTTKSEGEKEEQVSKRPKLDVTDETVIKSEPEEEIKLVFSRIEDKITTMEVVHSELLVGTEGGDIIFLSMKDGSILHRLDVSSRPVTCIQFLKKDYTHLFVGCLEPALRLYDFDKKNLSKIHRISDEIRCMDSMWDYVFMGGKNGYLIRYGCKKKKIEFEEQTGSEILSLKAAQEGPRCILIVGHRNAAIYVRDALSGLFLRQFSNDAIIPTVYSLVVHKSYVYCGTAKDNILVFSFHEGTLAKKIVVDKFKGISCMSVHKYLLFIGCYNGSVYVYNLDSNKLESTLQSQECGSSIVCLQVLSKQVIIGKLRGGLESITLPEDLYC